MSAGAEKRYHLIAELALINVNRLLACVHAKPDDGPSRWILFFDNGMRTIVSEETGKSIMEAAADAAREIGLPSYESDGVTP
jgi:hypothetical protein